jgi:hypothetical protein
VRKCLTLAVLACCLAFVPTVLAAPAPAGDAPAVLAPDAGLCAQPTVGTFEPVPMAPVTCEECQQKCYDRFNQCTSHCSNPRICLDDCLDKESSCLAKCPC